MSIILKGGSSPDLVDVTTDKQLKVALASSPTKAGYAIVADASGNTITTTENGYLRVSSDAMILFDQIDGTALNTNIWTYAATGMTLTQTGGFITLNAAATTISGQSCVLNSVRVLPIYGDQPLRVTINAKLVTANAAGGVVELGLGTATTTGAPTDGAFFRWTSAATFVCVINNGGTETVSAPLTAPAVNDVHLFQIVLVEDLVQFFIDDVRVASVSAPLTMAYPVNSGRQPLFARTYNTGVPAVAPQLSIAQVSVVQEGVNPNKPWRDVLASLGRGSHQLPVAAFTQTANHANSTSPATAALSNTAAGYPTLGGRFQFAAPAGASTDYALFAFQVPAGYQLHLTGVSISAMNTGVAVATTATILDWSVAVNSSAVSLATTDSLGPPQTWAPRRIPLGLQGWVSAAPTGPNPPGYQVPDVVRVFDPPLVADSNRYVHLIVQVPVGTATAGQVIRGTATFTGFFE